MRMNGGRGNPRNVVVLYPKEGMRSSSASNSTANNCPSSTSSAVPVPPPPSALYTKSGYHEIPSPHPCNVLMSMRETLLFRTSTSSDVSTRCKVEALGWITRPPRAGCKLTAPKSMRDLSANKNCAELLPRSNEQFLARTGWRNQALRCRGTCNPISLLWREGENCRWEDAMNVTKPWGNRWQGNRELWKVETGK